mmetsp:Transcript_63720/g.132682  ORF Transcript_63720/g.132682 Transcript_63720/m.132682 type:complete len:129 (+) Transcript_63720:29-415(+)
MIILETMQAFIFRLIDRVQKESGVPLNTPDKVLGHARFKALFNHKEFLTYIERHKYKDKRLNEVKKSDTDSTEWSCKFLGHYFNCIQVFEPPKLENNQQAQHFITLCVNKEFKKPDAHDDDKEDEKED